MPCRCIVVLFLLNAAAGQPLMERIQPGRIFQTNGGVVTAYDTNLGVNVTVKTNRNADTAVVELSYVRVIQYADKRRAMSLQQLVVCPVFRSTPTKRMTCQCDPLIPSTELRISEIMYVRLRLFKRAGNFSWPLPKENQ